MASANCTIVAQTYNGNAYGTSTAYAGFNYNSEYYTYRLKFTTPEFSGKSTGLTFNIQWRKPNVNGSTVSAFSLRWALLTTDDQYSKYYNHKNEVIDDTDRLATGRVELSVPADYSTASFTVPTTQLAPGTTYFLYMWGDGSTGKNQNYSRATPITNHTIVLEYAAKYSVELNHCLVDSAGALTWYSRTIDTVDAGASYTPSLITPPDTHTAEGATFKAWVIGWLSVVGEGTVGVDYITVNEDLTLEVYYHPSGSLVYVMRNGSLVEAEVWPKQNGALSQGDIYVMINGTAVKV